MSDSPGVIREARLRSAYQHLYLSMEAEVWYVAASFPVGEGAEWEPAGPGSGRALSDLHFDFRRGEGLEPRPRDARTRREDQPSQ
jgi:hypothetical protein